MEKSNRGKRAMALIRGNRTFFSIVAMLILFNMIVVTSVAWFTLNRKTDAEEMGMALAVDDTVALYKAYMYNLTTGEGTDKNGDGEELNIANIELNPYDTIFKGQNKYTPVFARIELVRNSSMPWNGTVHITVERNSNATTDDVMAKYSSSILRFTAFVIEDKKDLEKTTAKDLYAFINSDTRFKDVESYGEALSYSKNFISVDGTGEDATSVKSDSLTISVDYTEAAWYQNSDEDWVLNVYLYMTYDAQLIQDYMDQQTGGGMSLDDNTVFFDNDLTRIRVSYTAKAD